MIDIFIKNLPIQLASSIKDQYDNSLPIFKSYAKSDNEKYYLELKNNYEISCFLLGLSIFYKSVLMPLKEANSCFADFKNKDGVSGITIGKYTFSDKDKKQIQNMYNDMQKILEKHKIPESVLLSSDIKEFARNLNLFIKNKNA